MSVTHLRFGSDCCVALADGCGAVGGSSPLVLVLILSSSNQTPSHIWACGEVPFSECG